MGRFRERVVGKVGKASAIDSEMERASEALEAMRYFEAATLARRALGRARSAGDFERMARIVLPLQEARRQIREAAADTGRVVVLVTLPGGRLETGAYLVQPPLIGVDARAIREHADRRESPVLVVCREPMTRTQEWPVVAVGLWTIRTRVKPPEGVVAMSSGLTRDRIDTLPEMSWMLAAGEALGDAAIASVASDLPPAWRADDLLECLDAIPDHEKLAQALERACREAIGKPIPERPRRRAYMEDPTGF